MLTAITLTSIDHTEKILAQAFNDGNLLEFYDPWEYTLHVSAEGLNLIPGYIELELVDTLNQKSYIKVPVDLVEKILREYTTK